MYREKQQNLLSKVENPESPVKEVKDLEDAKPVLITDEEIKIAQVTSCTSKEEEEPISNPKISDTRR